ncbi:major capsid protein [Caulobacter phage Cr30]|uniref:major head protein n=1 Tax=Caulobacter phage Cr30 TaxID=1357714 RepID=UPI0004A9B98D|nr:major head protein [Caulobacter phage Cr30]AGS81065.1 major capsid protein [Caulobacter phage Cr30]
MSTNLNEEVRNKWKPILEGVDADGDSLGLGPALTGAKANITARLLENTEKFGSTGGDPEALNMTQIFEASGAAPTTGVAGVQNYDPVLISLIRRTTPNLMAYDIAGVQPMNGPTGLIFAITPRYTNQTGSIAWFNEPNTGHSTITAGNTTIGQAANNVGTTPSGNSSNYNFAGGMSTAQAEALGSSGNADFREMSFSIEKVSVTAKSRALKALYSQELAQDLKAVHGLDAETELSSILTTEILAEMNREMVRTIYVTATTGAANTTTAGTFDLDVDANGRWSVEKFKGLLFQIEMECNAVAKATRRGKGNILICSSNVASALMMAGVLDYAPALNANNGLNVDDTGNTFVGVLNGRIKVFIDPYASSEYFVVGYKGPNNYDSGIFWTPYIPLQMVRAVNPDSFQPAIGFKTRYGIVANPLSNGATNSDGTLVQNTNVFYRRIAVSNIF